MAMTACAGIVSTSGVSTKELLIDDFGLRAVMVRNGRLPDDDEAIKYMQTVAFGHKPGEVQRRTIKVADGYRVTKVSFRATDTPVDGDITVKRDNDGTLTNQLSASSFDPTSLTPDDEASPTLTATTANRDTSAVSWIRVEVDDLDFGGTGEGLEMSMELTRL
jgi:hypothetical protein